MPRWTVHVLNAAAVYNLAWGAFVVLFPTLPFRMAGMEAPNYPAIVQCLGMIVGVYGVGYAIAARDPVTQWPLVLVGLLGKVLGPIGFVYAATSGEFPWRIGVTILTNDLAWWIPFVAILFHAGRVNDFRRRISLPLIEALEQAQTQSGQSLLDLSRQQDLLVVCLRHAGCTYCREALHDLSQQRSAIEAKGVRPVVVHMGTVAQGEQLVRRYGYEGLDHVSDPNRRLYRALQLPLGTLSQLVGIQTFWRALVGGVVFRYGFGNFVGNGLQMPGAFLIRDGKILKSYRHQTPADRTSFAELADHAGEACSVSS
jgi:peroxiredoxin